MDRNPFGLSCADTLSRSLSARRAWIEIMDDLEPSKTRRVALRKESVDRNLQKLAEAINPSVALRKESVDRNIFLTLTVRNVPSRSPQGERG